MENEFKFQLISGDFSPPDATQILLTLINSKIKYHSLESLSNEIRYDCINPNSKIRIEILQNAKKTILEFVTEAQKMGLKMQIESVVQIKLIQN